MISGNSELVLAANNEPAVRNSAQQISIGLGPYMSPSRPNTGVATAAVSSVAVIAHDALAGLVFSSVRQFGQYRDDQRLHQRHADAGGGHGDHQEARVMQTCGASTDAVTTHRARLPI